MAKPKKQSKEQSNLVSSLQFVSVAQKDTGTPIQTHCSISNGVITASNGILSAGIKINEDLSCCPHTYSLLNALSKCDDTYSITQLENSRLSIKSGKFSVFVPCLDTEPQMISPDAACVSIGEPLRVALGQVQHLAVDTAPKAILSAVLLQSGSCVATSGHVILEAWHGISLPSCVLPKPFVTAICSTDKKLVSFGYSTSSVTFHFDDESWIKTQCYAEQFPDANSILNCNGEHLPLPNGFYDAIRVIEDFAENGKEKGSVYFTDKGMRSRKDVSEGAFYELEGLPHGYGFNIRQLKQVESLCERVYFANNRMWLQGNNSRGCVIGVR